MGGFSWNLIFENFSKICRENSGIINIGQEWRVLYMKTNIRCWLHLACFFLEWRTFQTKFVAKIKTHVLCSVTFFFNLAIYEIMCKYILEPGRPQMTIWRMPIACWTPKATNTPILCSIYCFSTATMVYDHTSILRYVYIYCLPFHNFIEMVRHLTKRRGKHWKEVR